MIIYKAINKVHTDHIVHYVINNGCLVYINGGFYFVTMERIIDTYLKFSSTTSEIKHIEAVGNDWIVEPMIEFKDADDLKEKYPEYLI